VSGIVKSILKLVMFLQSGIVKLSWHECQPLVYTCTLEGVVHLWDARTGDEERHWMGHEASILDMQVIK